MNLASVGVLLPIAEMAYWCGRVRSRLRHHAICAIGELVDAPQLFGAAAKGWRVDQFAIIRRGERASVPAMVILKYGDPG